MDKILEYHYGDHNSEVLTLIDSKHMSKIAEYSEDIQSFVDSLERKAGMTYALVNAMSAGEYYGSNRNGDYFPKKALKDYHKTFESNGHVYKHHVNKDPRKSLGRVAFSHYNPGMNRVELVLELSDEKATDIIEKLNKGHLPAVSMGCFPADTPVIMDDMSKKPISEIEIGDEVLSHTGQLKEVTELHPREYEGEMYIIKPVGKYREPVSATKEHPWLVVEPNTFFTKDFKNRLVRNKDISLNDAVWKTSEELTGEELLVWPKPKTDSEVPCTIEKAKLLGWYLAEGHTHTNDNGVEFSVHKDDQLVDEIEKVAENYSEGNINYTTINSRVRPHSEKSLSITIYDKGLKEAALKYCGKYSDKKRLHKEIFSWEAEAKLAFIGSYISGDGFFHEGQAYISSCNKQLLEQIQWLALSIDIKSTLGKNSHKAGKGFSAQDTFEYTLRFFGDNNSRLSSYCNKIENVDKQKQSGKGGPYEYSSFMLVKIDSIESNAYKGRVYNFEVADNNSYVVQNWAVHNCKVPFDECSICHCKAKTLQNYCGHLKNKMNQVLDDGRKVYAINTRPKFFDLSIVTIPADSTAGFISKLASAESTVVSSAKIAESLKHSELESNADIKKKIEVSADIDMLSKDPKELVYASQGKLSADEIEKLSQYPLEEVLSTFLGLRIMPRQEDFQKLALYSIGQTGLADDLEEHKIVFSPDLEKVVDLPDVKTYNFNEKIAGLLRDSVPQLSLTKPLIVSRAIEKAAAKGWIDEPSIPAGALGEEEQEILFTLLKKHGILETGPKTDSLGWEKQIEGEPSQLKQFIFGHTPDPKLSPHRSPLLPMAGLGAAYTGYAKLMDTENLSGFFKLVKKFPWIMPLIAGAGTVGSLALQDGVFNKTAGAFGPSLLVSVPVSYLMAGAAEAKTRRDEAISPTENFIRKHPFLMALGMSGLASGGLKMIKRAELLSQMDSDSLDDLYNELIDED